MGRYLRLTLTYDDGEGKGKTLTATSDYHVLSSRSVNSSPAFQDDFDPNTTGNQEPAAKADDNATAGTNVGDAVTASDANNDRLTYSLEAVSGSGADADVFQIDRKTGQVKVGLGKTLHPQSDGGFDDQQQCGGIGRERLVGHHQGNRPLRRIRHGYHDDHDERDGRSTGVHRGQGVPTPTRRIRPQIQRSTPLRQPNLRAVA